MKNKEKFADKIIDFACTRDNIAVNVKGEVVGCSSLICENCKVYMEKECTEASRKWLEEEYVEPLVISKKDRAFLECIKGGYKYIARDHDGDIFLYTNKPEKGFGVWYSKWDYVNLKPFNVCFPMVKCDDSEPWKIKDLKNLKVCENYETD